MRIFFSQDQLDKYVAKRVVEDRLKFIDAVASKAAAQALHYYTSVRTIEDWRRILEEAEKSDNKYMSMAELVAAAGFKK